MSVSGAVSMSSFSVVVLAAGYGTRLLADVELRPDLPQWRYLTQVMIVGAADPLTLHCPRVKLSLLAP